MIHSFKAKNFYSFQDDTVIDFTVNNNAPHTDSYFTTPSGTRLSKLEAIVGPNAAGKSTLLKVVPFMRWLIAYSYSKDPDEKMPFQCSKGIDEPAELEVTFEINESIYTYAFTLDRVRIWAEKLKVTSAAKKKKSTKILFSREWSDKDKNYSLTDANFGLPKGADEDALIRANASIVSAGVRFSHKESKLIADYWDDLLFTNVDERNMGFNIRYYLLREAVQFYKDNPGIAALASDYMANFDLGLSEFSIENVGRFDEEDYEATFAHSFNGEKALLPLHYESSGTQQLFIVLTYILKALENGGVIIIDEIDMHLHPDMQVELIELFTDPVRNPKNAQFLFSTQSPAILNKLDKYQIVLCEKQTTGYSEAWRLDEVDGVRADDNYGAKYLAGAYGATPRL